MVVAALGTDKILSSSTPITESYRIRVDYDLLHHMQIQAARFDEVSNPEGFDRNLIWNSPSKHLFQVPKGKQIQEIVLLRPEKMVPEEIINEMGKLHLRPTISFETLAFAATFPDAWWDRRVSGLGSQWQAGQIPRVLVLHGEVGIKRLTLEWPRSSENDNDFLLAVRTQTE